MLESSERVVIMLESDPQWCKRFGYRREEVVDLLRSLGFGVYGWSGRSGSWQEILGLPTEDMFWAARDGRLLPDRRILSDGGHLLPRARRRSDRARR